MRNDHKNHQQHQKNINQRNDVRIRRNTTLTAKLHSHESPRMNCQREDSHIQRTKNGELTAWLRAWQLSSQSCPIPAPRMMSMARATSMKSASLSPLTNAIFFRALLENLLDARAKLIEARIFLIDLDFAVLGNWTTTVLFSSSMFCC